MKFKHWSFVIALTLVAGAYIMVIPSTVAFAAFPAVTGLSARQGSATTTVVVSWGAAKKGVKFDGYAIFRSEKSGLIGTVIGRVGTSTQTFADSKVKAKRTYYYRVGYYKGKITSYIGKQVKVSVKVIAATIPASSTPDISCTSPVDTAHMDIFDSHAHVGTKVSASQMIREMDKAGVSMTNLYGDASLSLAAMSQYPGRFITFVTTPESPDPTTWSKAGHKFYNSAEEKLKTGKFSGIGETNLRYYGGGRAPIAPPDISVPADDPLWLQLVDLSAKYHVPISFHFVPEDAVANAAFEKMLSHNKDTILIWAHLGFNQMPLSSATLNDFLLRYPHLYFDTAGIQGMQNPPIGKGIQNPDANWDKLMPNGQLTKEWKRFFETWNSRIMVASDAGGGANGLERWLNLSSNTSNDAPPDALGHWRSLISYLDSNSARNILSGNSRELFLKEQKKPYTYSVASDGKCYSISVSSESSVSALTFNQSTRAITLTVANSNDTTGNAVIIIPTALAGTNFTASVDGKSVKSQSTSDSANTTVSLEYAGGIRSITLSASSTP